MSADSLREGSIFHEKYQVVRAIAAGGMGAVYEVVHLETQRRRALKVMLPSVIHSEELRNRFRAEARVASGIESEHIVETFDAGVDRATGMPFLVMELLKGKELEDAIAESGRLSPERALPLLAQIARTLDRTHAARVVHRDLKPANIFLTTREDGSPHAKILDFGIAKIVAEGQGADKTRSLGTPLYMAPEQFDGSAPISPQTDLFALAHITYTALVGAPFWSDEMKTSPSLYGFLMAMQREHVEPASARAARSGAALPPGFDAWFARATAKNAASRFSSATEQHAALEQLFRGAPAGATVPGAPVHYASGPVHHQQAPQASPYAYTGAGPHAPPHQAQPHQLTSFSQPHAAAMSAPVTFGAPAQKKGGGAVWALVLLGVLLVAGGAAGLFLFFGQKTDAKTSDADDGKPAKTRETAAKPEPSGAPVADTEDLDVIRFTKKDHAVGSVTKTRQSATIKVTLSRPVVAEVTSTETSFVTKTILAADGKTILKMKLAYGEAKKVTTAAGNTETEISPVSGKTFIAAYEDGDVDVTDENGAPVTLEAEAAVVSDAGVLGKPDPELTSVPDVPMKRGDRADTLAELFRGSVLDGANGSPVFSDVSVILTDIKLENGVKVGVFTVSFKLTGNSDGMSLTTTMKGPVTMRSDTAKTTKAELTGPVTISDAEASGSGTFTMTIVNE